MAADRNEYLREVRGLLRQQWPENRAVNIVCHGHSVPAGYFATPFVDTFHSYPHLLHRGLKDRFPFSVVNVIVTAIGGETSAAGAARLGAEVLCHRPNVLTIDYSLNDRSLGLAAARAAWTAMIEQAQQAGAAVLLMTPTADLSQAPGAAPADRQLLLDHAAQVRDLAECYAVGLVDSLGAFDRYTREQGSLSDLLSWGNHPNRAGHELVVRELLRWFPAA